MKQEKTTTTTVTTEVTTEITVETQTIDCRNSNQNPFSDSSRQSINDMLIKHSKTTGKASRARLNHGPFVIHEKSK